MGSEAVNDDLLGEVPTDAAILIAGPPMTGKYELLLRLLRLRADRVIFVTTKHGYERVRSDFESLVGSFDAERLGIVDCVSYHHAVDPSEVTGPVSFTDSPENLTRIGVKFTGLFDEFLEAVGEEGTIAVGLHSVSQLLMHSEVKQVYQFLQVLVGQIRNAGHQVVAVVDVATTDDETVTTLQQHFDGLVLTRENDAGRRECRIRGLGPSATAWTEF